MRALDKQHRDAEKKTARATERARQQSRKTPLQKNAASECFGLSRVRCAGWLVRFVFVRSGSRESLRNILFSCSFKVIKQANKLLGSMR